MVISLRSESHGTTNELPIDHSKTKNRKSSSLYIFRCLHCPCSYLQLIVIPQCCCHDPESVIFGEFKVLYKCNNYTVTFLAFEIRFPIAPSPESAGLVAVVPKAKKRMMIFVRHPSCCCSISSCPVVPQTRIVPYGSIVLSHPPFESNDTWICHSVPTSEQCWYDYYYYYFSCWTRIIVAT